VSRSITTIAVLCLAVAVAVAAPAGGAADPHHASSADTTAPKAYYGFPAGSVFPSKAVLVGMARDDRKVVAVRVAVKDVATGLWRQKSGGWGPQRTAWKAELSDRGATFATWTHRADLPDGTYRLDVRVEDRAGNTTRLRPRRLFSVDETAPKAALLVAAGDIARCTSDDDEATATLLDGLFAERSGVVAVLGDTAYRDGTASDYADCYDPTWGRHATSTTRRTPGRTGTTSAPERESDVADGTGSTSAPGGSSSSTPTAPRSAGAGRPHPRESGWPPSWRTTPLSVRPC